jgi:hypothetical protein
MKYPRLASLFALVLTTALLWCSHAPAQHLVNITDPQSGTGIAYKANAKAISAAYTMKRTDHTLLADATSAAFTIGLLPAGTNQTNQIICIQKTDSSTNAVTIDANASETIDGNTTYVLRNQYQSVFLQAAQSTWHVIGYSQFVGIGVLAPGATPAFAPFGTLTTYTLTPAEDETIAGTVTGAVPGRQYTLIVLTSGTTSRTLTFGANFKTTGTLATGTTTAKYFVINFVYNGSLFVETGRTTAM